MDIICPKCGEPWEFDSLHDAVMPFEQAAKLFRTEGCGVVFGNSWCDRGAKSIPAVAAIYDLLGDDMDGAASMLDDAEFLGMLD